MTLPENPAPETSDSVFAAAHREILDALLAVAQHDRFGHACCPSCYPALGTKALYAAVCGRLVTPNGAEEATLDSEYLPPANACPDCTAVIERDDPCPACGYTADEMLAFVFGLDR